MGLRVSRCSGLSEPIFADATVVSREFISSRASPHTEAAKLLSGGGFRELLEHQGTTQVGGVRVEDLAEKPPGCYIAVNRKKPEDALRYAQSIRAFLTATYVRTGGRVRGLSMDPRSMFWSAIPGRVWQNPDDTVSCNYHITTSNCLHLTPVEVTQDELRSSWVKGEAIAGSWTISKSDALAAVLVGNPRNGLHMRIRDACVVLSRAMESPDSIILTLFGSVALETLLGHGDFSTLEKMCVCLFSGERGPEVLCRPYLPTDIKLHMKPSSRRTVTPKCGKYFPRG